MGKSPIENELAKEIVGVLFLIITIILYTPALLLIILRKKTQPIRHRSPNLLFISLVSSFIIAMSLSTTIFLSTNENNYNCLTCNFYIFSNSILHFILILPYIFRGLRLIKVFNIQESNTSSYKRTMREQYYLKILSVIFFILLLFYFTSSITGNIDSVFPIELKNCRKTSNNDELLISYRILWLIVHLAEVSLIIYSIIQLRNIKDDFKISNELITMGLIWLGTETIFLIDASIVSFIDTKIILIIDIMRNYLLVFVSGYIPLSNSFKSLNIPICTTKECASNFNILLITEKTYDCFHDYLLKYMPDGAKFLTFWTELNVFKHSSNRKEVKILSTDIYYKYFQEGSEMYIDFPPRLMENFNNSYKNTAKNIYNDVFDYLGEFAYTTLKEYYYPNFKNSKEFKHLENELENDEIIYSRLVASSMISSMEIE